METTISAPATTSTPQVIVRRVTVDRNLTPEQVIAHRVRTHVEPSVLKTLPGLKVGPKKINVYFFELDYDPTATELASEYKARRLKADAVAQAQVNADDPTFADERPNACYWNLRADGTASCAHFGRYWDMRRIDVYRRTKSCSRIYRFGGVRK